MNLDLLRGWVVVKTYANKPFTPTLVKVEQERKLVREDETPVQRAFPPLSHLFSDCCKSVFICFPFCFKCHESPDARFVTSTIQFFSPVALARGGSHH